MRNKLLEEMAIETRKSENDRQEFASSSKSKVTL